MRKRSLYCFALIVLAALVAPSAFAQCVSLTTAGSAYTQNFDTLSNVAGSTTNNLTIPGWFMTESGGGARDNEQYAVDTGGSTTGDTYSYGAAGSTERALGQLRSGTLIPLFGACFTNNTGATITSLAVAYNGEEWRLGTAGRTDQMNFEYSTNATDLVTGTWTNVAALNFVTPDTVTTGAKNGNAAADRTALSSTISSLNIPNGATFWIRWNDTDASGADDGLAVDDFSLTPSTTPTSTNPTANGSATPNPVVQGNNVTLNATVTPGTNPPSTGTTVTCNLSAIGGSAAFALSSGDGLAFSASYAVPAATTAQAYTLPCVVADSQPRSSNFNIALTVNLISTNPSGVGSANPNSLLAGATTLLTVTVTGGTNPASSSFAVTGNLSSIGGSAAQAFFDDGTHGDVTPNDNVFSFSATVDSNTSQGTKTIPVTIADQVPRTGSASISLTIQPPPAPKTVKISQVYGGGGNSGSTYKNDFIELYNPSSSAVDITGWSVQQTGATATTTWSVTPLCPTGTCTIPAGHYFLVAESQGTSGATTLPAPDASGAIAMGATSGKVALLNTTTALSGACPSLSSIADMVGYGGSSPTCFEGAAVGSLDNVTAAVRKGNGCVDTDNNNNDFLTIGPIPRNSSAPAHTCAATGVLSGLGSATPDNPQRLQTVFLQVTVTPATGPASTGITVTADLTALGGSATQQFYDDGTHGDTTPGDNVFTFPFLIPATMPYGVKYIPVTIQDAQARTSPGPITITAASPTCGVERWNIKVGLDSDAGLVNVGNPVRTSISALRSIPVPAGTLSETNRYAPTETTVWKVNGLLTIYKLETDVDYHIVLKDPAGNTIVTEIPFPFCDSTTTGQTTTTSPFDAAITSARAKFDAQFTAGNNFQTANVPVQMTGVGFFDLIHGQTGVAPNGIELHPILDLTFTTPSTTALTASANPSNVGQPVTFTATVTSAGGTATGNVSFFDGATLLGTSVLSGGVATFSTSALTAGAHAMSASYEGDSAIAESSGTLSMFVKTVPLITWATPTPVTYGSALGNAQLNATANVPGTFVYNPPAGTVPPVGNDTLSTTFTPTDTVNYATAQKSVTLTVNPAATTPANLVMTKTLVRSGGQIIATISLANTGQTDAQNVTISVAKIGTTSTTTPLPVVLGTIAAGTSAQTVLNFPGTVGATGAATTLTVSGSFTGSTFNSGTRITLP